MKVSSFPDPRAKVKTVRTAMRLLREFSLKEPELGVSELARRLDLDKATVHRLLTALAAERVVEQDPVSKHYRLGFAILDFAALRLQNVRFLPVAVEEIHALCDQIGESVAIHMPDQHEMICLAFAEAQQPVRVTFWIGERSPMHLTATGLAAMSTMEPEQWVPLFRSSLKAYPRRSKGDEEQIRDLIETCVQRGFAVADETYEDGVRAIAVPVQDTQGGLACTICIAAPAQRATVKKLQQWVPSMREVAQRISRSTIARREPALAQRSSGSLATTR